MSCYGKLDEFQKQIGASIDDTINYNSYEGLYKLKPVIYKYFDDTIDIIKLFFLENDNCKKMHEIYGIIKENLMPYNKINTIDTNMIMNDYNSYIDGMYEFINLVKTLTEDNDINMDSVVSKVDQAISRDSEFISDLFTNKSKWFDDTIKGAMNSVEFILDYINEIPVMQSNCDKVIDDFINITKRSDCYIPNVKVKSCYLYIKSLVNFNYMILNNIFSIFENIKKSICKRESSYTPPEVPLQIF